MLFSDATAGPAQTQVADLREYPEWHCGRERYGVWIVPVLDPELLEYIRVARDHLADLLHPSPRRQPHLTVFVCGFHGEGGRDDDFPLERLEQQVALLKAGAGPACSMPLAGLDSFASAAFIPVGDPMGRLAQWRNVLGACSSEIRQAPYVAHITLGLYRRCISAAELRQRLGEVQAPPPSLSASELQYVTYDARDQLGRLDSVRRVMLDAAAEPAPSAS
ncbi:2'-5' RNA ligase family protein [Dyella japonica]|uniref:2'-5' RNA ligase family protein n=1 Tax=Dyella japonica TaxID=231455 RepID=UPI0006993445|nr:2'-5' RNA ligase family protein [Dyella japonica]